MSSVTRSRSNSTLMAELQELTAQTPSKDKDKPIRGIRVVYADIDCSSRAKLSNHSDQHNKEWERQLEESVSPALEVGTITGLDINTSALTVIWDCGVTKDYTYKEWKKLRVYGLGSAGYLGQMVFCDKCLEPSKGLAFRLARDNVSMGDLYDLCVHCYNEQDDEHVKSHFHCNIPSGNIDQELADSKKVALQPREESTKYTLFGIFKQAIVETYNDLPANSATDVSSIENPLQGEVLNIVHEKGNYDLRKSKYYDSCAEVKLDTPGSPLVYREAGSGGRVELRAIKPGKAPFEVPIEHYPKLDDEIVREMFTYKSKLLKLNEGDVLCYCFMRRKPDQTCYSLTISGTRLTRITDPQIWEQCKDLEIVILLMNELDVLPKELLDFKDTIKLVCMQNNKFIAVPEILYELIHLKHLNLHGNEITRFPDELSKLTKLERFKFGNNKLYSLPDLFNSFNCLIELTLHDNHLTRLPPTFADLKQLESIDLTDNSFTSIPAPLLHLPKLKSIYLRYNRIHRLAPIEDKSGEATLTLLKKLVTLRLRGNPIYKRLEDDPSISLEKVKADYFKLEQMPGPVPKALRVLVLGSCGGGKTSIVQALSFNTYVTPTTEARHDHTVGINRFSVPVQIKDSSGKEQIVELRLWDFAGERTYIMMNNLFVTDGTLIWITVNFEQYDCTDESFLKHVASWIQQILTKTVKPIVWIIGTHTDKCKPGEVLNKKQHIEEKIERECDVFKEKIHEELATLEEMYAQGRSEPYIQKIKQGLKKLHESNVSSFIKAHLKVLSLTNTYGFDGFDTLHKNIELILANGVFGWHTSPLDINQQIISDKLRDMAEELLSKEQAPLLSKTQVIKEMTATQSVSATEAEMLLDYLYRVGEILLLKCGSPSDSRHDEMVILEVDWLINLLKQIFHHDFKGMIEEKKRTIAFHCLNKQTLQQAVKRQQETGIVSHKLLDALWRLPKTDVRKTVTTLLEATGLAYLIQESPDGGGYLFPWLVTQDCPANYILPKPSPDPSVLISYDFAPCLPVCFIQELAVRCQTNASISIKSVYKNRLIIRMRVDSTLLNINVLASPETKSLGGSIYLHVTTSERAKTIEGIANNLWEGATQVIRVMESMLCCWTFYNGLEKKIYCAECHKGSWSLQLWSLPPPDYLYICPNCEASPASCLMAPKSDQLFCIYECLYQKLSCQPIDLWWSLNNASHQQLTPPSENQQSIPPSENGVMDCASFHAKYEDDSLNQLD